MGRYLTHRGPDDWGEWTDGAVFLGHNRLSIIDIESGQQPLVAEEGRAAIVFNGEIYNYKDLWRDLESRGCPFKTDHSDTEVILNGYLAWGVEVFQRLEGMFALALWDARSGVLHLVRDRSGIKPLYFAKDSRGLLFASEPKALLASGRVAATVRQEGIAEYFLYRAPLGPGTLLQGIEKVQPATRVAIHAGGRVEAPVRYWEASQRPEPTASDVEEALSAAVCSHLVSDVPLGIFLSGGVDSSLIAAFAAKVTKLETFTVGTESTYDESGFAREAAEHCGLVSNVEVVRGEDFLSAVDDWSYVNDDPSADPSALALMLLSRFARSRGMKVMLAGEGSDELFGGYNAYVRYSALGGLGVLRRPLAAFASGRNHDYLVQEGKPHYLGTGHLTSQKTHLSILGEELEASVIALRTRRDERARGSRCREAMLFDQATRLPDDVLMRTDRATMFFGLEARVPFLDRQVVEFANSLPDSRCVRAFPPATKMLLKDVALRYLPARIILRPKRGFDLPVDEWLRKEFSTEIDVRLSARQIGALDYEGLRGLVTDFRERPSASASGILWAWLVLERWHQMWTGRLPPARVPELLKGLPGVEKLL
jgi:asparagine synthase (glutamine-hydrolysing)